MTDPNSERGVEEAHGVEGPYEGDGDATGAEGIGKRLNKARETAKDVAESKDPEALDI